MKLFPIKYIVLILLVLLFNSCKDNHIYQKYQKIPDYVWNSNYSVSFDFNLKDTNSIYNVYFNIRNSATYPYSNIWVILQKPDNIGMLIKKRYEFVLANSDGSWRGVGLGDIFDNHFILEERVKFKQIGEYTYTFKQNMRVDDIKGIMDIGLEIEKLTP